VRAAAELTGVPEEQVRSLARSLERARRGGGAFDPPEGLTAPADSLSSLTGVFRVIPTDPNTHATLVVGQRPNGELTGIARFRNHHPDEIAFHVYEFFSYDGEAIALTTRAQWRQFVATVVGRRWDVHHGGHPPRQPAHRARAAANRRQRRRVAGCPAAIRTSPQVA
jgi:hypothetical protein